MHSLSLARGLTMHQAIIPRAAMTLRTPTIHCAAMRQPSQRLWPGATNRMCSACMLTSTPVQGRDACAGEGIMHACKCAAAKGGLASTGLLCSARQQDDALGGVGGPPRRCSSVRKRCRAHAHTQAHRGALPLHACGPATHGVRFARRCMHVHLRARMRSLEACAPLSNAHACVRRACKCLWPSCGTLWQNEPVDEGPSERPQILLGML
jgi:hypothetical protein